ncbi:hypothetical protein [uncultured Sunxiuqinia sp.]|uniref:hypothetical protein n=1 Tax=uncultured Sunxiuqinia sp. TaxID=1573825 RepID=UPI0026228D8C|nr:hypothetical protein [uncultured Sunxiuqinia sp.]
MTTLRIKVDTKKNARLLKKLLQNIPFVKQIEDDLQPKQASSQYDQLKSILNTIQPGNLFNQVDNPVDWQKKSRDEWEAR